MSINLKKGEKLQLGLSKLVVGLGWDPSSNKKINFDLDITAFLLNEGGKLISEQHLVFYNNTSSLDKAVIHTGDDTTGKKTTGGEDEILIIDLEKIDPSVKQIVFLVTLDNAEEQKIDFGSVENSFISIRDGESQREIALFNLTENYAQSTALEAARLYIDNKEWNFEALGIGYTEELGYFVKKYYEGVVIY